MASRCAFKPSAVHGHTQRWTPGRGMPRPHASRSYHAGQGPPAAAAFPTGEMRSLPRLFLGLLAEKKQPEKSPPHSCLTSPSVSRQATAGGRVYGTSPEAVACGSGRCPPRHRADQLPTVASPCRAAPGRYSGFFPCYRLYFSVWFGKVLEGVLHARKELGSLHAQSS